MSYKDDLKTARDRAAARLKDALEKPKPNYSLDGESYSWSEYTEMLTRMMQNLNGLIQGAEPYAVVTRGIS